MWCVCTYAVSTNQRDKYKVDKRERKNEGNWIESIERKNTQKERQ